MSGLRAKNRALKHTALLDAATSLFEQQGFEATQMEDVAALAGTSTGTAYNYFESKHTLLTAVTIRHLRQSLPARRCLLADLPARPLDGIIAYERLLAQQTMQRLGKNVWRAIYRAAYDTEDTRLKRAGGILSRMILQHYRRMFEHYKRCGALSPDVDVELLADMVVMAGTAYFARFLTIDDMTIEQLLELIPPFVGMILPLQS